MNAEVFVLWDIYLIGPGFISYPQWEFPWEGILAGVHMSEALTPGLWAGCLLWAWQHRHRSEVTTGDQVPLLPWWGWSLARFGRPTQECGPEFLPEQWWDPGITGPHTLSSHQPGAGQSAHAPREYWSSGKRLLNVSSIYLKILVH